MTRITFDALPAAVKPKAWRTLLYIGIGVFVVSALAGAGYELFGEEFMNKAGLPFQILLLGGLGYYGRRLLRVSQQTTPSIKDFATANNWQIDFDQPLDDETMLPPDTRHRPVARPIKYIITGEADGKAFRLFTIEKTTRIGELMPKYETILRIESNLSNSGPKLKNIRVLPEGNVTFIGFRGKATYQSEFKQLFQALQRDDA